MLEAGSHLIGRSDGPADPNAITWSGVRSALVVFVLPSLLGQAATIAGNTIMMASIGRLAGVAVLAGVAAFFPVLGLLLAFLGGIGGGASILVGRAAGRGDLPAVKQAAANAVTIAALLGLAIGIAGFVGVVPLLRAFGVEEQAIGAGADFARVALLGAPVLFVYAVFVVAIQGTGDARTPLYGAALQLAMIVVLVPLGVAGAGPLPPFGAAGAAAGFVLSSAIAGAAVALRLTRLNAPLGIDAQFVRSLRLRRETARAVLGLGVPSGLNAMMLSLSEISMLGLVTRQGTRALAAYGAVGQVMSFIGVPSGSIASAASVFGSQAVGAGRYRSLRGIAMAAAAVGIAASAPFALLIDLQAAPLMRLFVHDPLTVALGVRLIHIVAWSLPLTVVTQALAAVMRSTGDVSRPTLIAIGSVWAVQLPVAFVGSAHGVEGIWTGYPAGYVAALLMTALYYLVAWRRRLQRYEEPAA